MAVEPTKILQPTDYIIKQCQSGDKKAYKKLVNITQPFAYNIACKILPSKEDAKDALQDCYLKIWHNINAFDSSRTFTTWMYKILVNICLDMLKKNKNKYMLSESQEVHTTDNEQQLSDKDLISKIKKLSMKLPYKQRVAFILKDIQGLSMDELEEILNMKKGQIKSNLYYARKYLREQLLKIKHWRSTYEM